jgi:hypothetical protein
MTSIPLPKNPLFKNLTGQKFGRLTCVSLHSVGPTKWNCVCDCGVHHVVAGYALRSGETKSCGCLRKEQARSNASKHGLKGTPLYSVWLSMKTRCLNPKSPPYKDYGGRGIKICARWKTNFKNFYEDMSPSYRKGLQIDRVDNDGDYCPENCRWSDCTTNIRNRRNTLRVNTSRGPVTVAEAAHRAGVGYSVVKARLARGDTGDRLFRPVDTRLGRKRKAA